MTAAATAGRQARRMGGTGKPSERAYHIDSTMRNTSVPTVAAAAPVIPNGGISRRYSTTLMPAEAARMRNR